MTPAEFLTYLNALTVWKRGGVRAPHKPLLILLALGRVAHKKPRLAKFSEIEKPLHCLLTEFGPRRKSNHPEYPFWYLQNSKLWEVEGAKSLKLKKNHREPKLESIRNAKGGFLLEAYELLNSNPKLVKKAVADILNLNFPESLHADLLTEVGISSEDSGTKNSKRDPDFRNLVVRAYQHSCAVCGFDIRLGGSDLGLEAAHIWWHQAGGPDVVENGLCLCAIHHRLFDRGAFVFTNDRKLVVSEEVHGSRGLDECLFRYEGQPIKSPQRQSYQAKEQFLEWHRTEVFKSPARERVNHQSRILP